MNTWKSKKTVCRSRKSGKFSPKGKCGAFKKQRVKKCCLLKGQNLLFK